MAPIAATLIQLGISRSREYLADRTGAEISGDPEALALALEKLEQGAQLLPMPGGPSPPRPACSSSTRSPATGSILQLFSTHPPHRGARAPPARHERSP